MCFDARSSLLAGAFTYGSALHLFRRENPRLKWCAVSIAGISAMQWAEGFLWLDGPVPQGALNHALTTVAIPLALVAQPLGPLLGSLYVLPLRRRRFSFFLLLLAAVVMVTGARLLYQPVYTQVTPDGHLNWWSPANPPVFSAWSYGLWAGLIGTPFLLWWRPFWQAGLIVSWGWLCALVSFVVSDSAASHWCFYVSFYALFTLIYAATVKDPPGVTAPAKAEA